MGMGNFPKGSKTLVYPFSFPTALDPKVPLVHSMVPLGLMVWNGSNMSSSIILKKQILLSDWIMGYFWCQFFPMIFYGNSAVTLFSLLAVTINRWAKHKTSIISFENLWLNLLITSLIFQRWVLIYYPRKADKIFSRLRSKIMIFACWATAVLMLLPSLTGE